jgi:hypothetical protein
MKLSEMLPLYRGNAAGTLMEAIATEFQALSAAEQRELLFWMLIDTTTNPNVEMRKIAIDQAAKFAAPGMPVDQFMLLVRNIYQFMLEPAAEIVVKIS